MTEECTEYVGLYLTPTMAKQLKEAKNTDELKDKIIKNFITNETDWLKSEMKDIDEIVLRYKAKLLTIKDHFTEVQDIYIDEIEKLLKITDDKLKPLSDKFKTLENSLVTVKDKIGNVNNTINDITKSVGYIDYSRIERLLDCVDRFNKLQDTEKELIRLLLKK